MLGIIKRPLVTEKNTYMSESGTYVFQVDRGANKVEIRRAVEKAFRVKVESVRTSVCRGRPKKNRYGAGKVKYWKKAYIKLKEGEKMALFEGV